MSSSNRKLYLRVRTVEQEAAVHVGEQLTDSCEQRLDEETKTETLEHRGTNITSPAVCSLHEENPCVSVAACK